MIGSELKRGRHLLVTVGRYAVVAAVACVLLILLYQTRHLYQQYVRLEKIKSNNFELEGVESNFRDLEESMDKVARHYKRVNSVFEP